MKQSQYKKIVIITLLSLFIFLIVIFVGREEKGRTDILKYKTLLFAHRGECSNSPENTLQSIQAALDKGYKAIEIDIAMTKDGEIILIHDKNTERLLGIDSLVKEMTFEGIKKYPILKNGEKTQSHICTLNEVYDLVGNSIIVYLDIKDPSINSIKKILKIIETKKAEKNTLFADGNLLVLRYVKWENSHISTVLEGSSPSQKKFHPFLLGKFHPDYFSGFLEKMDEPYAKWMKEKGIIDSYILYSVDSTNVEQAQKWNFKNMIIDNVYPSQMCEASGKFIVR